VYRTTLLISILPAPKLRFSSRALGSARFYVSWRLGYLRHGISYDHWFILHGLAVFIIYSVHVYTFWEPALVHRLVTLCVKCYHSVFHLTQARPDLSEDLLAHVYTLALGSTNAGISQEDK